MITKIVTYVAGAIAAYAMIQVTLANRTISKQVEKIEMLEADNATLRLNQETLRGNLEREVEARQADRDRWEETLKVHERYLSLSRLNAKRFADLRDDLNDMEGRNDTSSDFLTAAGQRLWPVPETTDTGTNGVTNLSGSGNDTDTN